MRLDKYLAETAQCTRSEAKALLAKGRVTVNGAVCRKGDTQLKEADAVAVDGKALAYRQFVSLMLNKPEGVVSASTDKRDTTVVDLVGDAYPRRELFPAGRLDKTSTGFVLLTDDGGFAHDILAPRRHVSKTYTVVIDTPSRNIFCCLVYPVVLVLARLCAAVFIPACEAFNPDTPELKLVNKLIRYSLFLSVIHKKHEYHSENTVCQKSFLLL